MRYAAFVERISQTSRGFYHLNSFLDPQQRPIDSKAHFTIATISFNEISSPNIRTESFTGADNLADELQRICPENVCKLFPVENGCPKTVCFLGEHYDIDLQFFADHLNNEPWYRIENVAERIPALPSRQKLQGHLQLRFIETLTVPPNRQEDQKVVQDIESQISRSSSDARSFMHPAAGMTNVPRKA